MATIDQSPGVHEYKLAVLPDLDHCALPHLHTRSMEVATVDQLENWSRSGSTTVEGIADQGIELCLIHRHGDITAPARALRQAAEVHFSLIEGAEL